MGDRFWLKLKCAYCGLESNVYYAPTCSFYDFKCQETEEPFVIPHEDGFTPAHANQGCGKTNFITASFGVKKAEDVIEEDIIQSFEMASTANHSLSAIKKEAQHYLRQLKKQIKKKGL